MTILEIVRFLTGLKVTIEKKITSLKIDMDALNSFIEKLNKEHESEMSVIGHPPKLYQFSEALGMMKQGKWMKSVASDRVMAVNNTFWKQRTFDSGYSKFIEPTFTVYEIEGRWQEVTE